MCDSEKELSTGIRKLFPTEKINLIGIDITYSNNC